MKNIKIVQVKINDLKPALYNPRKISDADFEQLTESIRQFNMVEPLVLNSNPDRHNTVVGGHQRLRAALKLGYETVPVVYVNLSEDRERALNLRLNRNTGEFDLELLKNFDIDTLLDVGFDDTDLAGIWDDALSIEDDNFDVGKAVEQIKTPTTKAGDVYLLDRHRLVCGDSTDPKVIKTLMDNKTAKVLLTDPKFNIDFDYSKGVSTSGKYGGTTDDNLSDSEYRTFLDTCLKNALQVLADDCHVFFYCDQRYIGLLQNLYAENQIDTKRVCLWVKNNFNMTPNVAFNKGYEPCIYGAMGKPYLANIQNLTEILNKEIAVGNRTIDDIVDLFDIWLAKRDPAASYQHPTQKPPSLHEKALKRCSAPGDIILDIFAGGGSLMAACEQLNRHCYMVEIEPVFCDVIIARYEELSGKKAMKL